MQKRLRKSRVVGKIGWTPARENGSKNSWDVTLRPDGPPPATFCIYRRRMPLEGPSLRLPVHARTNFGCRNNMKGAWSNANVTKLPRIGMFGWCRGEKQGNQGDLDHLGPNTA